MNLLKLLGRIALVLLAYLIPGIIITPLAKVGNDGSVPLHPAWIQAADYALVDWLVFSAPITCLVTLATIWVARRFSPPASVNYDCWDVWLIVTVVIAGFVGWFGYPQRPAIVAWWMITPYLVVSSVLLGYFVSRIPRRRLWPRFPRLIGREAAARPNTALT